MCGGPTNRLRDPRGGLSTGRTASASRAPSAWSTAAPPPARSWMRTNPQSPTSTQRTTTADRCTCGGPARVRSRGQRVPGQAGRRLGDARGCPVRGVRRNRQAAVTGPQPGTDWMISARRARAASAAMHASMRWSQAAMSAATMGVDWLISALLSFCDWGLHPRFRRGRAGIDASPLARGGI